MKEPKLKPYLKKLDYSYAFGIYPVLDMFKHIPDRVLKLIFHPDAEDNPHVKDLIPLCESKQIPYEFNEKVIEKLAYKENTYVIGVFEKYEKDLKEGDNHIVLVNPRNMGNLGTIIRTMIGLNYQNLAIIRPAADIFDPKVVRSAMGALFQLNFTYFDDFETYREQYPGNTLHPFMLKGGQSIDEIEFKSPFSLVFGNEGQGLPDEYSTYDKPVFLPQSDNIDSLNLSIAAGIGMWEASRK